MKNGKEADCEKRLALKQMRLYNISVAVTMDIMETVRSYIMQVNDRNGF